MSQACSLYIASSKCRLSSLANAGADFILRLPGIGPSTGGGSMTTFPTSESSSIFELRLEELDHLF